MSVTALAGCASTALPPSYGAAADPYFAAGPNRAELNVERSWNFFGGACTLDIFVDNRLAAKLDNGEHFVVWVAPGRHNVRGQTRGCMGHSSMESDVDVASAVTLRVGPSIGDFGAFAFDR